jgi:signal transduction histidine kinase
VERARADQAITTRDEFMEMVTHDLRTMLTSISWNAAMLVKNAAGDEAGRRVAKSAGKIHDSTVRINRLVGDLLDIASIEAGRLAIAPQRQDANRVTGEVLDALQAIASTKAISLHPEVLEGPLFATFDHDRILQVLGNLVSNSIKFTEAGGRISIGAEPTQGFVRFFVKDTGVGIAADALESVFERFWQVGKNDRRGLGLGLFISKCIVEAHGGRIWATSQIGAGSTFFFTVPMASGLEPDAEPEFH